ncbi:MAG: hypothetical protein AB1489_27390 [Acidobacteriota bacterium]
MANAGSGFTIVNNTAENLRVAVFKKNYKVPNLGVTAWQVVNPPTQGGSIYVTVPQTYEVFINYPGPYDDQTDPTAGYQTPKITVNSSTGTFNVTTSKTLDGKAVTAKLAQTSQNVVPNEMHIQNQAGFGVWGHITKSGQDIYPPQIVWPGGVMMQDIRPELYVAVVAYYVQQGSTMKDEEIDATSTEVTIGQVATVSGSAWTGYSIVVANQG